MSSRLQLIEQKLISLNSAAFQNLGDAYLISREKDLISFNRIGSQIGKQKTIKGTPDTYFRYSNGSLHYVEYTTQEKNIVKKVIEDIEKCLTNFPVNEVKRIIICFNTDLKEDEEKEVTEYACTKNIRLELIGLKWLAIEIYSKYHILAKDLGVPFDTGQILTLERFLDEYDNKAGKLSTPLSNQFFHRKIELENIYNTLSTKDIIIISGSPGVGKTKIAIEVLNKFLFTNQDYSAFAVSKKDVDIYEDLRIHLQQDNNYILLIDDANRQLINFQQILGVFKEIRKGKIKLILTVRDYALDDVLKECFEFEQDRFTIKKFTDEEITEIIKSDSFKILNHKFQNKIINIADGNARLAIMAARLALEKQIDFLYDNVSELYDLYFQTFLKDLKIFENKILLKTLGLISFFFTIDRSNKAFIKKILQDFEIDYYDFNDSIDKLETMELLEIKYNHVKVSEQIMATYFFYKVFIKDELLSFRTLLFGYYFNWRTRFSDTIIPSSNSFGYENVFDKINNSLDDFLNSIYEDDIKVLNFFSLFCFYKRIETINYSHKKIEKLPVSTNPFYDSHYELNDHVHDNDDTLKFLSDFFYHYDECFIISIELSFEYCRKRPELFPILIRRIREKIAIHENDQYIGFRRQIELFSLLIRKFREGEPHYIEAFFSIAKTFLSHKFHITESGRKNTIVFYDYPIPINEITKNFRKQIWEFLFENYKEYPDRIIEILKDFRQGNGTVQEVREFDLHLMMPFIEKNLKPNIFQHSHFVNDFIDWLDRETLKDRSYRKLRSIFNSKEYEDYKKFSWNRFRDKQDYEFENHEEFSKLKEQDIRSWFVFKSVSEFTILQKTIQNTVSVDKNNLYELNQSLNLILEENFLKNKVLGFQLLEYVLNNYPPGLTSLFIPIKKIVEDSKVWATRLWNLFKSWEHDNRLNLQLDFLGSLPVNDYSEFYKSEFIHAINLIDKDSSFSHFNFEKFNSFDEGIIKNFLQIVVGKIKDMNIKIFLPYDFFEKYSNILSSECKLLEEAYIQQEKFNDHFDFERKGLKVLTQFNPKFLIVYVKLFCTEGNNYVNNKHIQIQFIWELSNYENEIEEILNLIIERNPYFGLTEHSSNILFNRLNEIQKPNAKNFLKNYISKYNLDKEKMNAVFNILRNDLSEFYEELFLHYLSQNCDVKNFQKIKWIGYSRMFSGNDIIGEIQANELRNLLSILDKCNNQIDLVPIRAYLKKEIEYCLKNAEWERKRKFIESDYY